MKIELLNHSKKRVSKAFVDLWVKKTVSALKKRDIAFEGQSNLIVVLIENTEMKRLNKLYRSKDYATDILSFAGMEPGVLGELVIAPDVIQKQAAEHDLEFNQELGYMLLHGILHLLGFDHERTHKEAQKMFKIQDDVFEELCQSRKHVSSSRIRRSKKKSRTSSR